jgi:hypothetical protein
MSYSTEQRSRATSKQQATSDKTQHRHYKRTATTARETTPKYRLLYHWFGPSNSSSNFTYVNEIARKGITIEMGEREEREQPPTSTEGSAKNLPDQIKGKKYGNELQLLDDLQNFGLRDLQIVLKKEGFAVWWEMPGERHRGAVKDIIDHFDEWKDGRTLQGEKEANVFVNDSFNIPQNHLRVADFAIFGTDRLDGRRIRTVNKRYVNPHVIVKFS